MLPARSRAGNGTKILDSMKPRYLFVPLMFLAFAAQTQTTELGVYLKHGGFLRALQIDTTTSGLLAATLPGGGTAWVDLSEVHFVKHLPGNRLYFPNGTSIAKKGFYSSLSFGYMVAERAGSWNSDYRSGFGLYANRCYRWSPALSVGLGVGYEAHEFGFIPLQLELSGLIGRAVTGQPTPRAQPLPISWRLQVGFNLPSRQLVAGGNDSYQLRGSWLWHPSVGLLLPSRRGPAVELEFGYRIQCFSGEWSSEWSNTSYKDRITLKSLSLRLAFHI